MNVMDLLALPPEITSALIYSGPGAGSLIEASAAWQRLGAELENTVSSYAAAVSALAESWNGPSAAAMIQAVQPYLSWMRTTAQQAQQTAASAQDAAAAFSAAHASVIPPAQVSANRTRLAQLLATNQFGRNLPAIAQTEDEYQAMWMNNSATMSRYQAAAAQATQLLSQFLSPTSIVNPSGAATQAGAVPATQAGAAAAATQAAVAAAPVPSPTLPAVPLLQESLAVFDPQQGWFGLSNDWGNQFLSSGFPFNMLGWVAQVQTAQGIQAVGGDVGQGLSEGEAAMGGAAVEALPGELSAAGLSAEPTAAMNVGVSLGKLTAPPAVVGLLPASQAPVQLASAATPITAADPGFPMLPPLMPPPISAGSGWRKRKQPKYEDLEYGLELKGTVVRPPPSAG